MDQRESDAIRGMISAFWYVFGFVGKHQWFKSNAAATGNQWRDCSNGVVWDNLERLNTIRAVALWISYRSQMALRGRLARSELQESSLKITST